MKWQVVFAGSLLFCLGLAGAGCSNNSLRSGPSAFFSLPEKRPGLLGEGGGGFSLPQGLAKSLSPGKLLASHGGTAAGTAALASPGSEKLDDRTPVALARLSERRGQIAQAEEMYKNMIEKDPKDPLPYHRLGVIRARAGKFREADAYFAQAMRLAPTDAELLSDVGYSYYLQRRLDEAEKTLRRALELKPGDPKACNNLAIVCGETGRYQESLALFQQSGSDAEAYANLAFIYAQQGKLQQAKAAYDRALSLNPGLRPAAEAMVQLAQYGETKRPATAVDRATPPQPRRAGNVVPASAEMAEAIPPQPHPPAPPSSTSTAAPEEGWSRASDGARTAGRGPAPAEPAATGDSAPPPTSSEQTDLWTGLKHSIAAAANRP